jgi:hypothetical protein
MGFVQQRQVQAEAGVGGLRAANALEHQVHRRALGHGLQGVGDMGQHAALRGHLVGVDQAVQQVQQVDQCRHAVGGGVDADHGIARAVHQPIQDAGQYAGRAVGRVVGLQAHRHVAGQAQGVAKARDHFAAAGHQHQVLVAHQLAHRGHHLGREAGGQRLQGGGRSRV